MTHWSAKDYFDEIKVLGYDLCKDRWLSEALPFNPMEYGITPTSLEATDTTQLLGMVAAREALKDAGYGMIGATTRTK